MAQRNGIIYKTGCVPSMVNRAKHLILKIVTHRKQQLEAILLLKRTLRKHYCIEFEPCSKMTFHRHNARDLLYIKMLVLDFNYLEIKYILW
jgi:hypothetical protein